MNQDNENDKIPSVPAAEFNLRGYVLDYLFSRGHRINKPLIDAVARLAYEHGQNMYEVGKNAGHAEQFAKDQAEGVEATDPQPGENGGSQKASPDLKKEQL